MRINREEVIHAMDRSMSEGNFAFENIEAAQKEIQRMIAEDPVDGTWHITSHRPVIGKLIILAKRFMRKMLHGYIPPIIEKFNQIEESQNRAIQHLIYALKRVSAQEAGTDAGNYKIKDDLTNVFSYVEFENRYRGNTELVTQWQNVYLEFFIGRDNVLDLGCGRGEFLTLLRENGIPGKGIDITDDMVRRCKELGLNVERADIFEYLEQVEDNSLDGVFCNQVVEHFTNQQLLMLVQLLNKKVRIGAPVVIETINPGNLSSAANGFYMDLSHIRLVHPCTLSFLLETNGFPLQQTLFLHPETDKEIPRLNIEGAEEFNDKMQNVNKLLFGARDYAIVAYRQ